MEPAIVCKALSKTYKTSSSDVLALRSVDLEVGAGELLMLVGPSGSGKTTLISVIAGILNQDQGTCIVFGHNLKEMTDTERTKFRGKNIGFVFQAFNLIPTLTTAENVSIPLLLNGVSQEIALDRATQELKQVGLGNKISSYPSELSGGQQQRVAIARALVHDPKLVVCDEPTSNLDQETGMVILKMFKEIALSKNRALIIVTHDSRIFKFADRIAILNDGRIEKFVSNAESL